MPQTFSGDGGASKCDVNSVDTASIQNGAVTPAKLSQAMTLGTAQAATSGTSIDFTSVPSWVKRITVLLVGVTLSGTSALRLRIGAGGVPDASGYSGSSLTITTSGGVGIFTAGFDFQDGIAPADARHYQIVLTKLTGNTWVAACVGGLSNGGRMHFLSGSKSISNALDIVRVTSANGTDTFTAGSVNIMYEG